MGEAQEGTNDVIIVVQLLNQIKCRLLEFNTQENFLGATVTGSKAPRILTISRRFSNKTGNVSKFSV